MGEYVVNINVLFSISILYYKKKIQSGRKFILLALKPNSSIICSVIECLDVCSLTAIHLTVTVSHRIS
jgi:hypothetical protein